MKLTVFLLTCLAGSYGLAKLRARVKPTDAVSPKWLVTNERREWQAGIDGVSWSWPIDKQRHEPRKVA